MNRSTVKGRLYISAFWLLVSTGALCSVGTIVCLVQAEVVREEAHSCENSIYRELYQKHFGKSITEAQLEAGEGALAVINEEGFFDRREKECGLKGHDATSAGWMFDFPVYDRWSMAKHLPVILLFWIPVVVLSLTRIWITWVLRGCQKDDKDPISRVS